MYCNAVISGFSFGECDYYSNNLGSELLVVVCGNYKGIKLQDKIEVYRYSDCIWLVIRLHET